MLAYVFWHWRRPAFERDAYEALQRGFHAALAQHPPAGFRRSIVFAIPALPWDRGGPPAYEDWYLLDGSAALDPLNDAAVAAPLREAHDAAAQAAAGGTAGLYRVWSGAAHARTPRFATWLDKPPDMGYPDFQRLLAPLVGEGGLLWRRQMTLGRAPECCLQTSAPPALPAPLAGEPAELRAVWPLA